MRYTSRSKAAPGVAMAPDTRRKSGKKRDSQNTSTRRKRHDVVHYHLVTRYNWAMVRHVDAIFSQGALRPLGPLALPEGTRVHLRVEDDTTGSTLPPAAKIHTPRLAHPEDTADFAIEVPWTADACLL